MVLNFSAVLKKLHQKKKNISFSVKRKIINNLTDIHIIQLIFNSRDSQFSYQSFWKKKTNIFWILLYNLLFLKFEKIKIVSSYFNIYSFLKKYNLDKKILKVFLLKIYLFIFKNVIKWYSCQYIIFFST